MYTLAIPINFLIIVGEVLTFHLSHKQQQRLKVNTLIVEVLFKINLLILITHLIIKGFIKYIEPFLNNNKLKLLVTQVVLEVLEV